jgi:hypothetical protein
MNIAYLEPIHKEIILARFDPILFALAIIVRVGGFAEIAFQREESATKILEEPFSLPFMSALIGEFESKDVDTPPA